MLKSKLTFPLDQVSTQLLLSFNRLKQGLEVACPKALKVVSLNDLDKHRRAIHHVLYKGQYLSDHAWFIISYLGKQLQQVTPFVKVNQDIQTLNGLKVLLQYKAGLLQPCLDIGIVCLGHLDKLHPAGFQVGDVANNVVGSKRNVLDPGAIIEVDILLDLGLFLPLSGLVDRHLDYLVRRRHHDTLQRGEFSERALVYLQAETILVGHTCRFDCHQRTRTGGILVPSHNCRAVSISHHLHSGKAKPYYSQILSISFQS